LHKKTSEVCVTLPASARIKHEELQLGEAVVHESDASRSVAWSGSREALPERGSATGDEEIDEPVNHSQTQAEATQEFGARPASAGRLLSPSVRSGSLSSPRKPPSVLEQALAEAQAAIAQAHEHRSVVGTMDEELVYLGGGVFAPAATLPEPREHAAPPRRERKKVLPGRVRPPPPRPLGHRSAVRSASAHLVGPITGPDTGDLSRANSEGQLGRAGTGSTASGANTASAPSKGPKAWRPSGPARLPPPPDPPDRASANSNRTTPRADGAPLGGNLDARIQARENARHESSSGLFGPSGVLNQLRDETERSDAPVRVTGPPLNSVAREAERRATR